ncbi:MAG: sulfur carrier protein ThiS [Acidobacteria bacterium]|nr:sulfur carrier protein ThiS [Acidobacteriota bacterium]
MNVVVNGDDAMVPDGASVVDLLHQLGLGEKWVIVERNGDPVERRALATTMLADGDRIELVRAVAGG